MVVVIGAMAATITAIVTVANEEELANGMN